MPTKYVRKSKWKLGCQTNFHSFTHVLNPTGLGLNKAFMIILQRLMLILKFSRFQQILKSSTYTLVTRSNNGAALGTMMANNARDENTYKYKR